MNGTPHTPLENTTAKVNNRDKIRILVFVFGLLLSFHGVARSSPYMTITGLLAIAVTVRYRKNPVVWFCLATFVLALVAAALVRPNWPLVAAIPLMLSYVFDYIDEQKQKRAAHPPASLVAGATNAVQPSAPANGGSAVQYGDTRASDEPPSGS